MSNKDTNEIVQDEFHEDGLEESAGSETLKPNPTRAEMLATFSQLLSQLKGEDLSHFFNDSIKKYSADGVPSATAPGGAPAIGKMPMPTLNAVKEDINEVFDGEDLTEEAKEKIRKARSDQKSSGWNWNEESRKAKSEAMAGRSLTDEHKEKIRVGRKSDNVKNIVTCPHCEKQGQEVAMNRWHFNNCKMIGF
jgi:hypothetical protein